MKPRNTIAATNKPGWYGIALLAAIIVALFWRSFLPDYVHFSNDGPLGEQSAAWLQMPGGITGMWGDLNYIGSNSGTYTLSVTTLLHTILSPVSFAKYYPGITLFLLGLGAWTFFRELKLTPLAAAFGAIAAMLNSTFFSSACWGVASQEIAIGMDFFALALIVGCNRSTPMLVQWTRMALAGMCIGVNVMEAADIGALFSVLVALFAFFHTVMENEGATVGKAVRGVSRVVVIAAFAGFIALQAVSSLLGTSISGIAGTGQDSESKAAHWDWATQWSLPKAETLGLAVPGLFGYKLDTPKDMTPSLQNAYSGGVYWGGVGRAPELDRYFDNGSQGPEPSGPGLFMRFTGGGNYCGILVLLICGWTIAQAFRRQNSIFPDAQKRTIQFWTVIMFFCVLFAWGRFAPFYALLYHLPYFSTIRNPTKFLILFSWALVIIFAYGVHALNRRYLDQAALKPAGLMEQLRNWWAKVTSFDRKWTFTTVGLFAASVVGWVIYSSRQTALIQYLQKVGFSNADPNQPTSASAIAAFSLGQLGWFLLLLAIATGLVLLLIAGYFNGPRAKTGAILLGGFLILDMGRANLPWVVHWDYKQKYEVGTLNPIEDFLRNKPYEHRAAIMPFETPEGMELFGELYRIEWIQHQFPFYNIQSLDIIQMPRMPEDMRSYKMALAPHDRQTAALITREWELTNTRYLLGAAPNGFIDGLNQQLDPGKNRYRVVQRFEVVPKPGITRPNRLEELTAVPNDNGNYALIEFTGALPRAKLYANWQVNTNDQVNLKNLGDLNFDPAQTVLISTPEKDLPTVATNENTGSVDFKSYSTKHIVFSAKTTQPSVLLLNDKFDPYWRVLVDGKPAELLRCNYIMRGVYVPTAGDHTIDFQFDLPHPLLYVTLTAFLIGLGLCAFLVISSRQKNVAVTQP